MNKALKKIELKNICTLVTDGTHDTPKIQSSGFPLIKAKEINKGNIDFEKCDFISEAEHLKIVSRSKPEKGDTLFTHIGASLGIAAFVDTDREFSIKNIALFKPNPKIVNKKYFYYLIIGNEFQDFIKTKKGGSAQPFVGLDTLRTHELFFIENLGMQDQIAEILSSYDDLIENNRRRIKILEEMARSLYREWFVSFHFPGHGTVRLVNSPFGPIPEGWEVKTIGHFGEIITGKTPSKTNPNYYGEDIAFVKIPDMRDKIFILTTGERLSLTGLNSQKNKTIPAGSLCVSCIGTIGLVSITTENCQTNQQVNSILLDQKESREYLYYFLEKQTKAFENLGSNGATMGNVNKEKFSSFPVNVPSFELLQKYHFLAEPIFLKILSLYRENKNLIQTRDLLLPRLLSGQLSLQEKVPFK